MLENVIYSIFFAIVDGLIFLKLVLKYKLPREMLVYLLVGLFAASHFIDIQRYGFMSGKDFFNICFFSLLLVFLHYGGDFQMKIVREKSNPKNETEEKIQHFVLAAFDFSRKYLIYILAFVCQIMNIWIEKIR